MVGRNLSEPFEVYLSVYTPAGALADRLHLGTLDTRRRHSWAVSDIVKSYGYEEDHLVVVHRVPKRLVDRYGTIDEPVDLPDGLDYHLCRAYVQYSYPGSDGAHGGVIYEIAPRHNELRGGKASTVLTFSPQVVLSSTIETSVVLLNCSSDAAYSTAARFAFRLYSLDGVPVYTGTCTVPPFSGLELEARALVGELPELRAQRGSNGLTHLNMFGICDNASLLVLLLNRVPSLKAVSIEHTHAPQGYLIPFDVQDKFRLKNEAMIAWRDILTASVKC